MIRCTHMERPGQVKPTFSGFEPSCPSSLNSIRYPLSYADRTKRNVIPSPPSSLCVRSVLYPIYPHPDSGRRQQDWGLSRANLQPNAFEMSPSTLPHRVDISDQD
ncbi:hypothetical protein CDAR_442881 [Caerostris darwini]|uniref:Uncharacterized protein n=1 Tax=Caerostris darwini TaxID=1538125 RepID=A0AAV4VP53_9ARAC|nr:hypothetical protein CDAR_442881 [Caerostris darwini]